MSRGHLLFIYHCIDCNCELSDLNFKGGKLKQRCDSCYQTHRRKQNRLSHGVRRE